MREKREAAKEKRTLSFHWKEGRRREWRASCARCLLLPPSHSRWLPVCSLLAPFTLPKAWRHHAVSLPSLPSEAILPLSLFLLLPFHFPTHLPILDSLFRLSHLPLVFDSSCVSSLTFPSNNLLTRQRIYREGRDTKLTRHQDNQECNNTNNQRQVNIQRAREKGLEGRDQKRRHLIPIPLGVMIVTLNGQESEPSEGEIRQREPDTSVYLNQDLVGKGTLFIAESRWEFFPSFCPFLISHDYLQYTLVHSNARYISTTIVFMVSVRNSVSKIVFLPSKNPGSVSLLVVFFLSERQTPLR